MRGWAISFSRRMTQEAYLTPSAHRVNHENSRGCPNQIYGQDLLLNLAAVKQMSPEGSRQQPRRQRWGKSASFNLQYNIAVTGLGDLAPLIPQKDILHIWVRQQRSVIHFAVRCLVSHVPPAKPGA